MYILATCPVQCSVSALTLRRRLQLTTESDHKCMTTQDAMNSTQPSGAVAGPPTATTATGDVMTVGSVITVAAPIIIFMAIAAGLLYLQHYFDAWNRQDQSRHGSQPSQRRRGGGAAGGRAGIIRAAMGGVDPDLLRSMPVTVFRGSKEEDAVECVVCLGELEDGEPARFLPRCGHGFHAECVDTWLASHTTCPLCRLTVAKPNAGDVSSATSLALRPVPPEPATASYHAANLLPASVLLRVSDRGVVNTAATMAADEGDTSASAGTTGVLVIEIPELVVATPTPRDAAKTPGSARPRSFRRLWSFGRQGAGPSSSCSCGGGGEGDDVEQGVSDSA